VWYPLLLTVGARGRSSPRPQAVDPRVTVVFCAHNEAGVLAEKIANCRAGFAPVAETVRVAAADTEGDRLLEINLVHPGDHKFETTGVPLVMTTIDRLLGERGWARGFAAQSRRARR
jgi:hypothetical protein